MAGVFGEGWARAGGSRLGLDGPTASGEAGARVLILDSRPMRGGEETAAVLTAILGAARRRVWITMAYFAPRTRGLLTLCEAASRGVDVRMILPGKSDVALVRHAGHGFFASLLSRGVRLYEYQTAVLHAKTLVADGLVSVIGSTNFDFRSFELNAECNFVIKDPDTGALMERHFEEDLRACAEIDAAGWRRRFVLHRLGDAVARRLAPML
jgi:cardiolipin synthase